MKSIPHLRCAAPTERTFGAQLQRRLVQCAPSHSVCLIYSYSKRQPCQKKKTKYTFVYASPPVGLVHDSPVPTLTRGVSAVCHYLPGETLPSVLWNFSGLAVPCRADVPLCVMIPTIIPVSLGDHRQCDCQMYSEGVVRHWSFQGHQNYHRV